MTEGERFYRSLPFRHHRRRGRRALPERDHDDIVRPALRATQSRAYVADQEVRSETITELREIDALRLVAAMAARAVGDLLDGFSERQLLRCFDEACAAWLDSIDWRGKT